MYQVIIVEDDPMVAEIDKQYVEHNSKMAIAGIFQNGQDALDFVRTHPVDLIMLDYYMPVMDGRTFLVKLRAEGILADVIMVTAASEARHSASCTPTACRTTSSSPLTTTASKPPCRSSWPGRSLLRGQSFNQEELDKVIAPEGQRSGQFVDKGIHRHLGDHLLLPAGAQERKALHRRHRQERLPLPGDPAAVHELPHRQKQRHRRRGLLHRWPPSAVYTYIASKATSQNSRGSPREFPFYTIL